MSAADVLMERILEQPEGRMIRVGEIVRAFEALKKKEEDVPKAKVGNWFSDLEAGQVCPVCGFKETRVVDSRKGMCVAGRDQPLWRVRRCMDCGERWSTVEVLKR